MKTLRSIFTTSLVALLSVSAWANPFTLVSLSGEKANEQGTLTYQSHSLPRINEAGDVAFGARFTEETANAPFDAALLFRNGSAQMLAGPGVTATLAAQSGTWQNVRSIALTSDSDLAFIGRLQPGHPHSGQDLMLSGRIAGTGQPPSFSLLASPLLAPLVDFAGTLDSQRSHGLWGNPAAPNAQAFSFSSRLQNGTTPDATGIWVAELPPQGSSDPAALRLAAIEGIPLNGGDAVIERPLAFSLNANRHGALLARLADGDGNENNNKQALWKLDTASVATLIAQTGDISPSSTDSFVSFGKPSIDASNKVVFWASLLNSSEEEGLYLHSGNTITRLASTAQPLNVFGIDRSYASFFDPVVNANGDLAALATNADGSGQTVLTRSAAGVWSIVASSGMQAPEAVLGVSFKSFGLPWINGNGQVAFQASLTGSGAAISDTTDTGIWALDANGRLAPIAQEGDTLEVKPGAPATIRSVEIGGFNANGQLALRYSFTRGVDAIAIVGIANVAPPAISQDLENGSAYFGAPLKLAVDASGQGPLQYQWSKDGVDIEGATSKILEISEIDAADAGNYQVAVLSPAGSIQSAVAAISVHPVPDTPVFIEHPLGDVALRGGEATLDAKAIASTPVTYQWEFQTPQPPESAFADIAGKTDRILSIQPVDTQHDGNYRVIATSAGGSATSKSAPILVTDKRLFSLSSQSRVGTGSNVMIVGFVIDGPEPKEVLIRGIGPGLSATETPNRLLLPRLELYDRNQIFVQASNRWGENGNSAAISAASAAVGGRTLHTDDSAMLVTLQPGPYTAVLRGQQASSGVGLIEAFEIDEQPNRMVNFSTRAYIGAGSEALSSSFIVEGDVPIRVLARAVGPTLADWNIAGPLQFPTLEIFNANNERVAFNDGWQNLWEPSEIPEIGTILGAFPLRGQSEDAAMIVELNPGAYTIKVSGENQTTGVALLELYAIP